jgi:putative redox protein
MDNENAQSPAAPVVQMLPDAAKDGEVTVTGGPTGFAQQIVAGPHHLAADEPADFGGTGTGPTPYDMLLAGLGACTSMTLRLYADAKKIPLEGVSVRLRHGKVYAADCATCDLKAGKIDRIEREIELHGPLTVEQRLRLMEIADRCPVHRTLTAGIEVVSRLV